MTKPAQQYFCSKCSCSMKPDSKNVKYDRTTGQVSQTLFKCQNGSTYSGHDAYYVDASGNIQQ